MERKITESVSHVKHLTGVSLWVTFQSAPVYWTTKQNATNFRQNIAIVVAIIGTRKDHGLQ